MDLIISKPLGATIPSEHIRAARSLYEHGFGIMFVEHDKVQVIKGRFELDEVEQLIGLYDRHELVCHFRYCTSGAINDENCQPLKVLSRDDGDPLDLYVVHDGILHSVHVDHERSDSRVFANDYLRPLLRKNPDLLFREDFQSLLSKAVGTNNKLIFMDHTGRTIAINEASGFREDGMWYSRRYPLFFSLKKKKTQRRSAQAWIEPDRRDEQGESR